MSKKIPPLQQSKKNIVRMAARSGWMRHTESEHAKDSAIKQIEREIGSQWQDEARQLASDLIDHWNKCGILEPPSIYAVGEPGCDVWDE